ncbi:MAG: DUF4367 domain-containing protein [Candidatus Methanoperedens sp.]
MLTIIFAVALGFNDDFDSSMIKEVRPIKNNQSDSGETMASTSTPTPESTLEKTAEMAIADAQTNVSFIILKPAYIPDGYTLNILRTSGAKFSGTTSDLEQAQLTYTKKNETLIIRESLEIGNDATNSINKLKIPWEFVDLNGVQGRFLEESNGVKQLSWETGQLNLTISSSAYNGDGFTGASLGKEEIIMMAKSIR